MRHLTIALALAAFALVGPAACGGKDANTKLCLEEYAKLGELMEAKDDKARQVAGGVYQSCGISCDITKDEDACKAFESVTKTLCDKEGKEACQKLCEGSNDKKNETACALAEKM